jgi:hypothetical protein
LIGISEALFSAAASPKDLRTQNLLLLGFSGVYLVACVWLVNIYGTTGLVWANCVNLLLRMGFAVHFATGYFQRVLKHSVSLFSLFALNKLVVGAFVISYVVTYLSGQYLYLPTPGIMSMIIHIVIGTMCLLTTLALVYLKEKHLLLQLKSLRSRTKAKSN